MHLLHRPKRSPDSQLPYRAWSKLEAEGSNYHYTGQRAFPVGKGDFRSVPGRPVDGHLYQGSYNTVYKLTPQEKIPMAPDSAGLAVESFAYNAEAKNFMLDINDIWVDYYQGEQVSINAVLYKDVQLWFDEKIGESDMTFDSADGYVMLFDFGKKLKPGKYYVKWGFERIGKVSTDKYIKKGNTEKVEVK